MLQIYTIIHQLIGVSSSQIIFFFNYYFGGREAVSLVFVF